MAINTDYNTGNITDYAGGDSGIVGNAEAVISNNLNNAQNTAQNTDAQRRESIQGLYRTHLNRDPSEDEIGHYMGLGPVDQWQNDFIANAQREITQRATPTVNGQSVQDFSASLVGDPSAFFQNSIGKLSHNVPFMGYNDSLQTDAANGDPSRLNQTAQTVNPVDARQAQSYVPQSTFNAVAGQDMTAAQGTVSNEAQVQAEQLDMQGVATGINADGTRNFTGEALNRVATQNISNLIDTSTVAGKLLAQELGEGNYTDTKSTVQGQLQILQQQFTDPATGEPRIPTWAAGTARNVSRIAAFKGMTGTAAVSAMSQAIMEASLPIAQQDAQFFQTLTLKNLDNRQQQTINTANVLSKMELTNLDNRMTAAVENAKNFMQMDLANLTNEQQSRVINNQNRIQSILEDAKAVNASRLFEAQSQNEMDMFYDQLNTQIQQYNATAMNEMSQFNATLEDSRERFYNEMQFNIDMANFKWRQQVTTTNTQMLYEATATDIRNMLGLSVENLNRLWDRADSLLDYAWKSQENQLNREAAIEIQMLTDGAANRRANAEGRSAIIGSIVGAASNAFFGSLFK